MTNEHDASDALEAGELAGSENSSIATDESVDAGSGAPPVTKTSKWSKKKRTALIAGVAATALIAGAVIATPMIVKQANIHAYHDAFGQLITVEESTAETAELADSTATLTTYRLDEAAALGEDLHTYAGRGDALIPKGEKALLVEAADTLTEALPEPVDEESDTAVAAALLIERVEADENLASPASWAGATADDVAALAPASVPTLTARTMDDQVNGEVVEQTRELLADAELVLASEEARLGDEEDVLTQIDEAVAATLPVLRSTAAELPKLSKSYIKKISKADSKKAAAVTSAGAAVQDFATADAYEEAEDGVIRVVTEPEEGEDETVFEAVEVSDAHLAQLTAEKITNYLAKADAASKSHKDKVAAEKKAAAAAAAAQASGGGGGWAGNGGNGWSGNSGGGWSGNSGGGWSGNSGGGWSGNSGGGWSGGGGGGSSSGGGCPEPPAGWFPTGGHANGCPTYAAPGSGGADDW